MAKKSHTYYYAFQKEQRSFAESLMVMNGLNFRRLDIHMILLMLLVPIMTNRLSLGLIVMLKLKFIKMENGIIKQTIHLEEIGKNLTV